MTNINLDPDNESSQFLLAMTLGQKTALNDEVSKPFMKSGTIHVFAINGYPLLFFGVGFRF